MGGPSATVTQVDPGASQPQRVQSLVAVMVPTRGNQVTGTVTFREARQGLEVVADVQGLPPGEHAYHVHVFGDCSAPDGASAGPHFHFAGSSFDKQVPIITGNLGELEGTPQGAATHRVRIDGASIHGPYSLVGRSVVIHERGNNPAVTPDGGAGKRLACGAIGIAQVAAEQTARR
jgi:Cu-Zn family superoxide dismutase